MELFQENGCLTDEALHGLIEERLDELGRLEVAEHLSFCDTCLERYTALLTDDTLKTPETPLAPKILSRVRSRVLRLVVNRYAACGAAAVLAFTLWGAGVFDRLVPNELPVTEARPAVTEQSEEREDEKPLGDFFSGTNDFFRRMDTNINGAMAWLMNPASQTQTQE